MNTEVKKIEVKKVASYEELDKELFCCYKAPSRHGGPIDTWYLWIPGVGLGSLAAHVVTEHEDGTITAKPSILVTGYMDGETKQAHGYLENGKWRDC